MSAMPQLDVSTYSSQVFWVLICFFALYFLFSGKFTPAIKDIFMNRSNFLSKTLDSAKLNISLLKLELKKQLNLVENAEKESDKIRSAALTEVSKRKSNIKGDVYSEIAEMSCLVSSTLKSSESSRILAARDITLALVKLYYKNLLGVELKNEEEALSIIDKLLPEKQK